MNQELSFSMSKRRIKGGLVSARRRKERRGRSDLFGTPLGARSRVGQCKAAMKQTNARNHGI
jgi:hypothetical protein